MYDFKVPHAPADFLAAHGIRPVLALSARGPGDKQILSALALGELAVLDMETSTAAEEALRRQIPFLCFRAVSDALDQDLGFRLEDISDEQGRVRPLRVLATIVKKPSILWAFYRLWRSSSLAAKNLCNSLASFLNLPASELAEMTGGIRIERRGADSAPLPPTRMTPPMPDYPVNPRILQEDRKKRGTGL
jgi:hypothetical protein